MQGFPPIVLSPIRLIGLHRQPTRNTVLVVEVLSPERGLENSFFVPDDKTVLCREQQHRKWQKPQHSGNNTEADPHQKVAVIERVTAPRKNSVCHESLDVA